jgi:hypothetical protein
LGADFTGVGATGFQPGGAILCVDLCEIESENVFKILTAEQAVLL